MPAGAFDRPIVLERKAVTADAVGDPAATWLELGRPFARVRMTGGREHLAAGAERTEAKATFLIRYRPGLTTADRVVYRDRVYDIEAITEIGRNRTLELLAVARS